MFAAAFLSEFFTNLSLKSKLTISCVMIISVILGLIVTPHKNGENND